MSPHGFPADKRENVSRANIKSNLFLLSIKLQSSASVLDTYLSTMKHSFISINRLSFF